MTYNKKDHYHQKAKKEGYLARSAYKLKELQQKYKLIKPDSKILDLGCSPGAWSQVAVEFLPQKNKGLVVGIDLEQTNFSHTQFRFIHGDIFEQDINQFPEAPFDCVLSDMAPKTSGIKVRDQARSLELAEKAFAWSMELLSKGGHLVIKIFESDDLKNLINEMKKEFSRVERIRPESTRQASSEIYLIGLNRK